MRQKYVRFVAQWTAVVNERKEEGVHTLTPAGCGESPVDGSQDEGTDAIGNSLKYSLSFFLIYFSWKNSQATNETQTKIHLSFGVPLFLVGGILSIQRE